MKAADSGPWVAARRIGADHPSLPGHFPGRPVVPAVVLLDEVVAVVQEREPQFRPAGLPAVKFVSPLLPDEEFSVRLDRVANGFRFECRAADRLLAKGSVHGRTGAGP